jgi:hypothetical protein
MIMRVALLHAIVRLAMTRVVRADFRLRRSRRLGPGATYGRQLTELFFGLAEDGVDAGSDRR